MKSRMPLVYLSLLVSLALALAACGVQGAASGPAATATIAVTPSVTPFPAGPPGSISGSLMYPADSPMPSLAIYAISVTNSHRYFHVTTAQGQFTYTITGIAPGIYDVVAYLASGKVSGNYKALVGGYTKCDPNGVCTDHSLIPVTVHPGEAVKDIGPNDYYGGTYPDRPS